VRVCNLWDRMHRLLNLSLVLLAVTLAVASSSAAETAATEKRVALVIGNAAYNAKTLATAVNDAALIAAALQSANFEVTGARDLDEVSLRRVLRDFTNQVSEAGQDTTAVVYFAGYALQLEGENYLVSTDAEVTEASNGPPKALRLSEMTTALAALHSKTTFVIVDAARAGPFVLSGQAGGLAWIEPENDMLVAFNAAPGTVARDVGDGYGPYARALAEMIREGNLTASSVFDRVRLRVHELTKGAQVPWDASRIAEQFKFLERASSAAARADAAALTVRMRSQPMRVLGAQDAYTMALLRDTFDAYTDFLADYWQDPMTRRVRALVAARRESIAWRRTFQAGTPAAYWSYLERYPRGGHAAEAGRILLRLGATVAPPAKFARLDYDVPPPLPDELEYIERPSLALGDPALGLEPPQPAAAHFLEPPPPEFADLRPAVVSAGAHTLPLAALAPLPDVVRIPADVVATSSPPASVVVQEQGVTKPVVEVPAEPERQASAPISSSTISYHQGPGSVNDPADSAAPPASAEAAQIKSPATPPLTVNEVTTQESRLPMVPSSSTASLTPRWVSDVWTPATFDGGEPNPVPTKLAPPSTDPTTQGWSSGVLSSPSPATMAVPPSANSKQPSTATIAPSPRSATPEPPVSRNRSRPIANNASSLPTGTDQVRQARKPPRARPLSSQAARIPRESPEASSPRP
jgi:uncharacterized caspase-like protein